MKLFSKHIAAGLLVISAAALVACGSSDSAPAPVVASNLVVSASPATAATTTAVLQSSPISFPSGVPALGTTAATTLTVATTNATVALPGGGSVTGPSISLSSGGQTATGVLSYGSCVFTVTSSTLTSGPFSPPFSPPAPARQVVVTDCTLTVATANVPATGTPTATPATLRIGAANSAPIPLLGTVATGTNTLTLTNPAGQPVVSGVTVVTVTPTGTGGG